jgi:hypothetical protein
MPPRWVPVGLNKHSRCCRSDHETRRRPRVRCHVSSPRVEEPVLRLTYPCCPAPFTTLRASLTRRYHLNRVAQSNTTCLSANPRPADHGNLAAGNVKSGARRRWHVAPPRPALGLVKLGWRRQGGNFSTARDDFGFVASLRRKHRSEVLKHRRRRTAVPPTRRGYRAPHADFTIVALLHECETVAGGD